MNFLEYIDIQKDGNCFFRAVSKFLSGTEIYHLYFKNITYNYIIKNKKKVYTG